MILFPCRSGALMALIWAYATSLTSIDGKQIAGIPGYYPFIIFDIPSGELTLSDVSVGPITKDGWRVTTSSL